MLPVVSLRELYQRNRMRGVQIRLPDEIREQAKALATSLSSEGRRITETDVYRSAIVHFFSQTST
jgi:hypothetical protein